MTRPQEGTRKRSRARQLLVALIVGAWITPPPARAEDWAEALQVRATLGGGLMFSTDQVGYLGFDTPGFVGGVQAGYALLDWLVPHVTLSGAGFPADDGAGIVLAPAAGASLTTTGEALRLYVLAEAGPAFTGPIVRPFLRTGGGVDLRLSSALTLGPAFGFDHVFQHDGPYASTDARFFWVGVSATFRPAAPAAAPEPEPAPPPRVVVRREVRVVRPPPEVVVVEPSPELLQLIDESLPTTRTEQNLLAPVLFRFDSAELEAIGVAMLHEVAQELAQRPEIELVEIRGYADVRGTPEYNADLSARRAQRVLDWLVEHGVESERLRVAAHGSTAPVESGDDEAGHEQNRRVVFRVVRMKEVEP
jgi:outer membrane protein OmpA-like peptidoglycan-associated protein